MQMSAFHHVEYARGGSISEESRRWILVPGSCVSLEKLKRDADDVDVSGRAP